MATAYVLINCLPGKVWEVAEKARGCKGVVNVDVITGLYDVMVRMEGPSLEELSNLVLGEVHQVAGVRNTVTCSVVRR